VAEAIRFLRGEQRGRLRDLSVTFAAEAVASMEGVGPEEARSRAERALDSGEAADRFRLMVEAQGGDPRVVDDPGGVLPRAPVRREVTAERGVLAGVDAESLGRAAASLGAGRVRKGDPIDPAVGIEFFPKVGDRVDPEDPIAVVHARDQGSADQAADGVRQAMIVRDDPVEAPPLVYGWYGNSR
jgi:thymidine phosphorylase